MALHPTSQPYDWTFRRVVWATLVLISVILGFWLLYRFNQVVFILFIAIVIGTVIRPAVAWLHQRGLPQIAGVILVYLLLLHPAHRLPAVIISVDQSNKVQQLLPQYRTTTKTCAQWMVNNPNQLLVRLK